MPHQRTPPAGQQVPADGEDWAPGAAQHRLIMLTLMAQNPHYGSLTKETLKDSVSKFFHNGSSLRKAAIASGIPKIEKILQWFANQKHPNVEVKFISVSESPSQPTTKKSK